MSQSSYDSRQQDPQNDHEEEIQDKNYLSIFHNLKLFISKIEERKRGGESHAVKEDVVVLMKFPADDDVESENWNNNSHRRGCKVCILMFQLSIQC